MPATPSQAKDGLKARLATISGLRTYDYQPDQVNPPFAFPTLEEIRYHATAMGTGGVEMDFTINLILSRQSERIAQDEIDKYMAQRVTIGAGRHRRRPHPGRGVRGLRRPASRQHQQHRRQRHPLCRGGLPCDRVCLTP